MKKILFTLAFVSIIPLSSFAQDTPERIREAGICFSNLDNFGFRFKSGTGNTLFRITLLSINGDNHSTKRNYSDFSKNNSFGFGFDIGFEKRKSITDQLNSYCGLELQTSYDSENQEYKQSNMENKNWTVSPGIGLILGLNYKINSNINISAEVVPSLSYSFSKSTSINNGVETKDTNTRFDYGFSSFGASLTLSYRFGKKD